MAATRRLGRLDTNHGEIVIDDLYFDLTDDEILRSALVLEAADDLAETGILASETEARDLLHSNLAPWQEFLLIRIKRGDFG